MTPLDLHQQIQRLRISQNECARLLDVNSRTMRRWAADPTAMPLERLAWLQTQRVRTTHQWLKADRHRRMTERAERREDS